MRGERQTVTISWSDKLWARNVGVTLVATRRAISNADGAASRVSAGVLVIGVLLGEGVAGNPLNVCPSSMHSAAKCLPRMAAGIGKRH